VGAAATRNPQTSIEHYNYAHTVGCALIGLKIPAIENLGATKVSQGRERTASYNEVTISYSHTLHIAM
jgi:hypothetical protein